MMLVVNESNNSESSSWLIEILVRVRLVDGMKSYLNENFDLLLTYHFVE